MTWIIAKAGTVPYDLLAGCNSATHAEGESRGKMSCQHVVWCEKLGCDLVPIFIYQTMAEDHAGKNVGECHPCREFEGMQPSAFITTDTGGYSCEQIIDALGLGKAHEKCS